MSEGGSCQVSQFVPKSDTVIAESIWATIYLSVCPERQRILTSLSGESLSFPVALRDGVKPSIFRRSVS